MPGRRDSESVSGPDRLGLLGKQPHEFVLWRLADVGVRPHVTPMEVAASGEWWDSVLTDPARRELLDPGQGGRLPSERAHRKRVQIEAMSRVVQALHSCHSIEGQVFRIIDFCGGSGHTALVLAALLPNTQVTIVDFNKTALALAEQRALKLGLSNVRTCCADVAIFDENFDLGLALHACGSATDQALAKCRMARACFVVSPCCVGKVGKPAAPRPQSAGECRDEDLPLPRSTLFSSIVTAEEYIHVAAAADFHSTEHPAPRRKAAKAMIELDRLAAMQQDGYCVRLGKLPQEARSPKDDVLWGWPSDTSASEQLQKLWATSYCPAEIRLCGYHLLDKSYCLDAEFGSQSALELLTPDATSADRSLLLDRLKPLVQQRDMSPSEQCEVPSDVQIRSVSTKRCQESVDPGSAPERQLRKAQKRAARQRPRVSTDTRVNQGQDAVPIIQPPPGPIRGQPKRGRSERRLLHELAHYSGLRHWTGKLPGSKDSCVLASVPPTWPWIWDSGISVTGSYITKMVQPFESAVAPRERLAWQVRSGWLQPRLYVVDEQELTELRHKGLDAGHVLRSLQTNVSLKSLCPGTLQHICNVEAPVPGESATPELGICASPDKDGKVSGSVPLRTGRTTWNHHLLIVDWPAAREWRQRHDLPSKDFSIILGLSTK